MKKLIIVLLVAIVGINVSTVQAKPTIGLYLDDDGGGGTTTYTDHESDLFSNALRLDMNESYSSSFTDESDVDWFIFTAPYSARVRLYTSGYRDTKITVYESAVYYSIYPSAEITKSSTNSDHTNFYSNAAIISESESRAEIATNFRDYNAYATFSMKKGETYFFKLDNEGSTAGTYYLSLKQDAYCVNPEETNPSYNQDSYTKLILNGDIIYSDNFDAIDSGGKIHYLDLTTYPQEVINAKNEWNSMSQGEIFYPYTTNSILDLVIIDTQFIIDIGEEIEDIYTSAGFQALALYDSLPWYTKILVPPVVNTTVQAPVDLVTSLYNLNLQNFNMDGSGVYVPVGLLATSTMPVESTTDMWILNNIDTIKLIVWFLNEFKYINSTDISLIIVDKADQSSNLDAQATIVHEMGHSLGFGDMYNTITIRNMEGSMNIMETGQVIEAGFCDLKIYNELPLND